MRDPVDRLFFCYGNPRNHSWSHVALLNPDHADPDLSAELISRNLNVARPDEYVLDLPQTR